MSDKVSRDNIDKLGSFDNSKLWEFYFWKARHEEICEALKAEGENFIVSLYLVKKEVENIPNKLDSSTIDQAISAIEALKVVRDSLTVIYERMLDNNDVKKAWSVTSLVMDLENDDLKWSTRKVANYVIKQHQKKGAEYTIPKIVRGETWDKIKSCITPKLRLWHIAYMIDPLNLWGNADHKHKIMADLYDAIDSGCLNANTNPPKIPKMIDDGQTIDRWEITIKDFESAIDSGCMKDYFKPYVNVWESYKKARTNSFGRIENPTPFLQEKIEMTGIAAALDGDFDKALISNIRTQKEQGINDKSKAFKDAMKAVEHKEGYQIIDSLDELEREQFEQVKEPLQSSVNIIDKNNTAVSLIKKGNGKNSELLNAGYSAFLKKYNRQPERVSLWLNLSELLPEYKIIYEDNNKAIRYIGGNRLTKDNYLKAYSKYLDDLT